jgi:6-phosphogluconolactonase
MAARAEVEVLPTREALMEAGAACFVAAAGVAIRAAGRFVVALAGGSTPKALYALLAGAPWAGRIEWPRVHFFWGDERCVPPDDRESNYRMTREALLAHVAIPEQNVHRIRGEDDPRLAAAAYERVLRETFATPVGPPRHAPGTRFDLVLLGMGDNGHTASLFPGLTAVREVERWVVAERVEEVGMWRVTLTPVVLNAAAEVVFLVSGAEKAPMLRRVLEGPREPDALPAQVVAPPDGRLRWLVDAPAAARLERI